MQGTRRSGVGTRTTPPTRKLIRKSASAKDIRHLSERVALERVLGLTTSNKNGLTCNPYSGIIAYPAGCVIVLFNSRTNAQSHIFNPEKKTLTALAFSSDGKYLASGESGHNPRVRVWEISDTFTQIAELAGHKFSINCVAFSPNLKYLVSVGDQHDMLVNIWNWRTGSKVACNKIGCKVRSVSFAENGSYFVTVGNRHVKYWYFDTEAGLKSSAPTPIAGRSGILGELRNNCFCDVGCGCGDNAANTYAVTKTGLLCSFNEKRVLDRWVELRSTGASSLTVNEKYIFCGCSDGIIRVFHPTTLHFISTLPKPHFLGVDVAAGLDASHMISKDTNVRYPDVVSLALDDDSDKLTCVYNDHSLYVWDVHDVKKVGKACSFLYHSACIWGVETYPFMNDNEHRCLPVGSFLTCSSDDTIRVWNIDEGATLNSTFPKNIYSKELLKIIYTDEELTNIQDISSVPVSTSSDMKTGMRCLQVSPDGQLLAAGDRSGNLRVYDLQFVDQIMKIEAHEAEILCVEFSDPESGYRLLATSSRDRLIHIFDINKDFALVQTIDDHASSVTAVRFNYDQGVFQLLSCGADKHIMFHTSQEHEDGRDMTFVRANTIVVGKATMYDMDIEPTRKFATTCGQDRNVRVYDIQSVKQTQCYKGSISEEGTLIKIQLDPSGLYAATSCSDKSVNIYDFEAGDCTAVMYGHSELVTGLKFTQDGSRLISVSGDNCIFIWKLVPTLTQAIVLRLHELGKHLPGDLEIETDPMSALKNTFLLPKNGKDDLHCDTIEEEEFHQSDPKFFDQFEKDESRKLDYRFSVGRLPAWAKKQIIGKGEDSDDPGAVGVALPSGRWAQRVNEPPVMRSSSLGQTTLNSTSTMDNTTVIKDSQSTVSTESTLAIESITTIEDSVFKDGQPYSSHNKTRTKKDESVIYIPASQEEFDAEMQSFQVTARTSSKSRKVSDDLSKKTFYVEDKQSSTFVEPAVIEEPGVDSDSIEDEEDEELSDNDENLQSDTEPGIEDDSIQSPLEQHFEYLAGDSAAEGEGEEAFYVNAQNSSVDSKEKKTGFLSRCRSSISAKFLSRSQKSQPGKGSQSTEEQRKRLDSLKRIVDQNQNYGQVASRQPNTKEAKRMKKLSAKSEPNLSFGMPPPSKVTNRKSSGLRRTSGAAESHVDLRSIKDSQPDASAKDRLRHLRGGSTGSLSPSELKSPSDIISMFNQRSSTPKTKQLSSPAKVTRTSKNSPGVSPVASPTRKAISSKFDEMELKLNNVNNIAVEQAVKRRPRRSGERPGMRHRPKSLVITPNSLDELIQINMPQAHSDTELDEASESSTRKKKITNETKTRRSLPASYQQNLETLSEAQPSVIMCDIQIDETVRNNSKKSLIDSTSSSADVTRTMISSRNDQTIVKRLSDLSEALEDKTVTGSVNVTREEAAPIVKHTSCPDEVKITVEEWNNRNSPPERDVPEMMEKEANNHEMELQKELLSEKLNDVCGIYEDEVTLTECNSAVEDFVKSFQEISCLQEKVFMQKDSHNRSKILKTLSTAYSSIADSLKQQKIKIDNNVQEVGKNGVIADEDVSKLLAAINDNHEQVEGKNAQTEKVIDILEHYSCAIVKLVEKKLKQDLLKEE